jgi:hypothetical protein
VKLRAVAIALRNALSLPTPWYLRPIEDETELPAAPPRLSCGVPDCWSDGIAFADDRWTIIDCPAHGAFTRHYTSPPEERQQVIIRVQDKWRQHATRPPPR